MSQPRSLRPLRRSRKPPMPAGDIGGKKAWTRATLRRADWLLKIPPACMREIRGMVRTLRANPMNVLVLTPDDYPLAACRAFMTRVRRVLDHGAGFCVLDRLPVDKLSKEECTAAYWVLSAMIARPVAQSFDAKLLYDVRDTGKRIATRVRGDVTSQELTFHTDYGFNRPPPYIGLLVLRTARRGGHSFVVNLHTVHNALRRRAPDLLARLYRPFYWNRQGEHAPGEPITNANPLFAFEGRRLKARINRRLLHAGHELMGAPMDDAGARAVDALYEAMNDPALNAEFDLEPGQIEYLNNWQTAHARTEYEDHADPDERRHLVRIFLRDKGARSYMG